MSWKIALGNKQDFEDEVLPNDIDLLGKKGKKELAKLKDVNNGRKMQLFALIVIVLIVNFVVLFFCRRHMKRQMSDQMNTQVQEAVT